MKMGWTHSEQDWWEVVKKYNGLACQKKKEKGRSAQSWDEKMSKLSGGDTRQKIAKRIEQNEASLLQKVVFKKFRKKVTKNTCHIPQNKPIYSKNFWQNNRKNTKWMERKTQRQLTTLIVLKSMESGLNDEPPSTTSKSEHNRSKYGSIFMKIRNHKRTVKSCSR